MKLEKVHISSLCKKGISFSAVVYTEPVGNMHIYSIPKAYIFIIFFSSPNWISLHYTDCNYELAIKLAERELHLKILQYAIFPSESVITVYFTLFTKHIHHQKGIEQLYLFTGKIHFCIAYLPSNIKIVLRSTLTKHWLRACQKRPDLCLSWQP